MPRKPRPLDRDTGVVRDASLVVIASEDTHAVRCYFDRFRPLRVQFKVLPTLDGHSSPEAIVARLDGFRDEYVINDEDELWYCGDIDHWGNASHISNLTKVLQHCKQAKYHVALSKPCFELWLFLHFLDVPSDVGTCRQITGELSRLSAGYSKANGCGVDLTVEMIQKAMSRAEVLDLGTDEIPQTPTTRIFRIVNTLLERESIQLR